MARSVLLFLRYEIIQRKGYCLLYVFFWVITRRLNFTCRRFGTLCLFHLHRQVGEEWLNLRILGVFIWEKVGSKIACANSKEGDGVGVGPVTEQVVKGVPINVEAASGYCSLEHKTVPERLCELLA